MKPKIFLTVTILCTLVVSCGRIDNSGPLSVAFNQETYDAVFYTPGQTDGVLVTSKLAGDPQVSLAEDTHPAISYDADTQTITWTEELPLGQNSVTVVVALEAATATTDIIINNTFEGTFDGGFNTNVESSENTSFFNYVQFDTNGELTLEEDGDGLAIDFRASGIWLLYDEYNETGNQTTVEFTYSYDTEPDTYYTFKGALVYDATEAYISGTWNNGSTVQENMPRGNFRINFLQE